jgi:hypothetical protein
MSRRSGQDPKLRVGEWADGSEYYFFQYWIDVPGREEGSEKQKSLVKLTI